MLFHIFFFQNSSAPKRFFQFLACNKREILILLNSASILMTKMVPETEQQTFPYVELRILNNHGNLHELTKRRQAVHTTQNGQNKCTKILSHETTIFGLKMIVKSGLEFFILNFYQSCYCPVQNNLPRKAELAWQAFFS